MSLLDFTPQGLIADLGGKLIDTIAGFFPNPEKKAEAAQALALAQLQGAFKEEEASLALLQQQAKINLAEAESKSFWVAGWRPGVGWACAGAFGYNYILQPFLSFVVTISGTHIPPLPHLDLSGMMPVLLGMLGLGGMRSYEKVKGINAGS